MCRVQLLTLNPKIIERDIINTRVLGFPLGVYKTKTLSQISTI